MRDPCCSKRPLGILVLFGEVLSLPLCLPGLLGALFSSLLFRPSPAGETSPGLGRRQNSAISISTPQLSSHAVSTGSKTLSGAL